MEPPWAGKSSKICPHAATFSLQQFLRPKLLVITWRGFRAGEMPFRGDYQCSRPTLDDNPGFFYLLFVVYLCGFSILTVWGALVLLGVSQGMRWQ